MQAVAGDETAGEEGRLLPRPLVSFLPMTQIQGTSYVLGLAFAALRCSRIRDCPCHRRPDDREQISQMIIAHGGYQVERSPFVGER